MPVSSAFVPLPVPAYPAPLSGTDRRLVWLLPLALLTLALLLLGSHYESNDDMLLTYTITDVPAVERLPVLGRAYVFWVGLSAVLNVLYRHAPTVPWYGLALYAGLYLAVAISFRMLLDTPLRAASGRAKLLWLSGFFWLFFADHVLYFNFTRVAATLTIAATLRVLYGLAYFRQRPLALLGPAAALLLALLIRRDAGILALITGVPAALLLSFELDGGWARVRGRLAVVAGVVVIIAGVSVVMGLHKGTTLEPAVDLGRIRVVDYNTYFFRPDLSPADKVLGGGVKNWTFADVGALTPAFFARAGGWDWAAYKREILPFRITEFSKANLNVLAQWALVLLAGWVLARRAPTRAGRWRVLLAVGWFMAVLFGMLAMKVPARIAASLVSVAALVVVPLATALPIWPRPAGAPVPAEGAGAQGTGIQGAGVVATGAGFSRLALRLVVGALLFYSALALVRSRSYRRTQAENEAWLTAYTARYDGQVVLHNLVEGAHFYQLHPLKAYDLHRVRGIDLIGWMTSMDWYAEHCRAALGVPTWREAQLVAAPRPDAHWILTNSYATFLREYHRRIHHQHLTLTPEGGAGEAGPDKHWDVYRAAFQPLTAAEQAADAAEEAANAAPAQP